MLKQGVKVSVERLLELKKFSNETLKAPGLCKIKQVELYKKWWQNVDPQYWDEMCPKPSDAVMQQVKSDKVDKWKQTTERESSSKSEKLQEQARKNAETERKKFEKKLKEHRLRQHETRKNKRRP
jgi:hypothetical protein